MNRFSFVIIISQLFFVLNGQQQQQQQQQQHHHQDVIFVNNFDNFVISENTVINTNVYNLTISSSRRTTTGSSTGDSTSRQWPSFPFNYRISGTNVFSVDPFNGAVFLKQKLDRETNDQLNFFVQLIEIDSTTKTERVYLNQPATVIISDENDNAPIFKTQLVNNTIFVNETSEIDSIVLTNFEVIDIDLQGQDLEVNCRQADESNENCLFFEVQTLFTNHSYYLGNIRLRKLLDYQVRQQFEIRLRLFDGDLERYHSISIRVIDIQNRPPKFFGSLSSILSEDIPIQSSILNLTAFDGDFGMPRPINYRILNNKYGFFSLNETSGELRTAKILDRELITDTAGTITVTVQAYELPESNETMGLTKTTADIQITIIDVNDEIPKFSENTYQIKIPENIENNSIVPNLNIFVRDNDFGNNSVFRLEIDDISKTFRIEPNENAIWKSSAVNLFVSNSQLDYENPNQRKFIVVLKAIETLTIEKFSSSATILIELLDVNDNSPFFVRTRYEIDVFENVTIRSPLISIQATDYDSPQRFGNDSLVYELSGSGSEHFDLDTKTGQIFVRACPSVINTMITGNCFDFETKSKYFLSYKVTDNFGDGLFSIVPLVITLKDSNDNSPKFRHDNYKVTIAEDSRHFDPEIRIEAEDGDISSVIHYSIEADSIVSDFFRINEFSGQLSLNSNRSLEEIRQRNIQLIVIANDTIHSAKCTVQITILDVNNNVPKFEKNMYRIEIDENVPIGTEIIRVIATDRDDDDANAIVSYRLKKGAFESFAVDKKSGGIRTSQMLDYDRRPSYELQIVAYDNENGSPSLSGTTTVSITLRNVNNKNPVFKPKIQKISVRENIAIGSRIYRCQVHDPDYSIGNESLNLEFRIDKSQPISGLDSENHPVFSETKTLKRFDNWFEIDRKSGEIYVASELNRSLVTIVNLTIIVEDLQAIDKRSRYGNGTVLIRIETVNKNRPIFVYFQRNFQNRIHLTTNQTQFELNLNEEEPIGTEIGCFHAEDSDSKISAYELRKPSDYVTVEMRKQDDACLKIKSRLDYESMQTFTIELIAIDSGSQPPPLVGQLQIRINLININDLTPIFDSSAYNVTIMENPTFNQFVLDVRAMDGDFGEFGRVEYNLLGDFATNLVIDSIEGRVRIRNVTFFDREQIDELTVYVRASDRVSDPAYRRSSIVPITIRIADANDNSPKFTKSVYEVTLSSGDEVYEKNSSEIVPILQVSATDSDSGRFGHVAYRLIDDSKKFSQFFELNGETGFLYVRKSEFFHMTMAASKKRRENDGIRLTVEARDEFGTGPNRNRSEIYLRVERRNDYRPEFQNPIAAAEASTSISQLRITENNQPETILMVVRATDADRRDNNDPHGRDNGRVTYHFRVNGENVVETDEFRIDTETGELRAKISFDRERVNEYELILVAKDHGWPLAYETIQLLSIFIEDTNDNRPEFLVDSYRFQFDENRPEHLKIGQVIAIDNDNRNKAAGLASDSPQSIENVYYHIVAGNENGEFFLDKTDGTIYSNCSFDRELRSNYSLIILASNSVTIGQQLLAEIREQRNSSMVSVEIRILDANDNLPRFEFESYYFGVEFDRSSDEQISQIRAPDRDDYGPQSAVRYSIRTSNFFKFASNQSSGSVIPAPFKIDPNNGVISLATFLHEYNQGRFVLDVVAQEVANNSHEAFAKVYIWIYEPTQSVRIIFAEKNDEIESNKDSISESISNLTRNRFLVGKVQQYVDSSGSVSDFWSEMHIQAIRRNDMSLISIEEIMRILDTNYDSLKAHYANYSIKNIIPFSGNDNSNQLDIASVAILLILSIIFVGTFLLTIICFYLKNRFFTNQNINDCTTTKPLGLMKTAIFEQTNTTENPLWIEQKLKLYEEQELTMQVFNENDQILTNSDRKQQQQQQSDLMIDNAYATLEHPSTTSTTTSSAAAATGTASGINQAVVNNGGCFSHEPNNDINSIVNNSHYLQLLKRNYPPNDLNYGNYGYSGNSAAVAAAAAAANGFRWFNVSSAALQSIIVGQKEKFAVPMTKKNRTQFN